MPLVGDLDDEDSFGDDYPRHFNDLNPQEKQVLNSLTPATIRSCEVTHDWKDDHQICVNVILNGIEFGAWWCGWEVAGAFKYWDSPTAKEEIVKYLKWQIENAIEDANEDNDEITPEDLPQ